MIKTHLDNFRSEKSAKFLANQIALYEHQVKHLTEKLITNAKIEYEEKGSELTPLDLTESGLHFGFLFASPLVRITAEKLPLNDTNYAHQISKGIEILKSLKYELKVETAVATKKNFFDMVYKCPTVLYISYFDGKNGSNQTWLWFEEENTGKHEQFSDWFMKLAFETAKRKPELVIISTSDDRKIDAFKDINHVVKIK